MFESLVSMKIESLDIPDEVKRYYKNSSIMELYPLRQKQWKKGFLEGKNLLAAIPTASGKTLLAELTMLKSIVQEVRHSILCP